MCEISIISKTSEIPKISKAWDAVPPQPFQKNP